MWQIWVVCFLKNKKAPIIKTWICQIGMCHVWSACFKVRKKINLITFSRLYFLFLFICNKLCTRNANVFQQSSFFLGNLVFLFFIFVVDCLKQRLLMQDRLIAIFRNGWFQMYSSWHTVRKWSISILLLLFALFHYKTYTVIIINFNHYR